MKQEHPHAAFFRAVADGESIENFQIRCKSPNWMREWREIYAGGSALFGDNRCEIRRKPRTIRIGDVEVQAGITEAPAHHAEIWIADPTLDDCAVYDNWAGCSVDTWRLKHGIVHLSKENAVAMGKALAALTEHKT